MYSDWKKTTIDLSAYIGQTITLEFITTDCFYWVSDSLHPTTCGYFPGDHSAYAYLDFYVHSIVTELKETDRNITVDIYPNPMKSEMNLRIAGIKDDQSLELKIFDLTGREVQIQKLKNENQTISIDKLSNGTYFVEIIDRGTILQKKKISIVK